MAIERVNQNGAYGSSPQSVTLTGCTAGNVIIIGITVAYMHTDIVAGDFSGSNVGSFAVAVSRVRPESEWDVGCALAWAIVTADGSVTVTFTLRSGEDYPAMVIAEYSGITTISPVGNTNSDIGTSAAVASGSVSTAVNSIVIGIGVTDSSTDNLFTKHDASWDVIYYLTSAYASNLILQEKTSSSGTYNSEFDSSETCIWTAAVAVFKEVTTTNTGFFAFM